MDQQAKEPIKAQIRLDGLQGNTELELRIEEYGNMTSDCSMTGDVFNPLEPTEQIVYTQGRWGQRIPVKVMQEADDRGKIETVTSSVDGNVGIDDVEILQNLEGD